MISILVVVGPDNETGFRKHLEELTYCQEIQSEFIKVSENGPQALQKIVKAKPDFTIIGARNWIKRNNNILEEIPGKKALLFVGPLGQDEISQIEIENLYIFMKWLDKGRIDYLLMGSQELTSRLNREDVIHFPAPFLKDKINIIQKHKPKVNRVSILNDMAIHKNILNSVAGISISKRTDEFIFNGAKKEYIDLFKRFGLEKKMNNVEFLQKDDYYRMIDKSTLLVHISYSEGFCYAVLESLLRGTPVLVSNAMTWFYHPEIYVKNPADHQEIAKKIDNILSKSNNEYEKLSKKCKHIAEKRIKENNEKVKQSFMKLKLLK